MNPFSVYFLFWMTFFNYWSLSFIGHWIWIVVLVIVLFLLSFYCCRFAYGSVSLSGIEHPRIYFERYCLLLGKIYQYKPVLCAKFALIEFLRKNFVLRAVLFCPQLQVVISSKASKNRKEEARILLMYTSHYFARYQKTFVLFGPFHDHNDIIFKVSRICSNNVNTAIIINKYTYMDNFSVMNTEKWEGQEWNIHAGDFVLYIYDVLSWLVSWRRLKTPINIFLF